MKVRMKIQGPRQAQIYRSTLGTISLQTPQIREISTWAQNYKYKLIRMKISQMIYLSKDN